MTTTTVQMASRATPGPLPVQPSTSFALIEAARQGDTAACERAIDLGIDPDMEDFDSRTALNWAAARGDLPLVGRLLARGAAVDRPNRFGVTALMTAVVEGQNAVVQRLIDAGADARRRDGRGAGTLGLALRGTGTRKGILASARAMQTARLLWQAGARPRLWPRAWAGWRARWHAALRADEFEEYATPVTKRLLAPLLWSLALALALVSVPEATAWPATLGLALAALLALHATLQALPLFPSAAQWLAQRFALLRPAAARPAPAVAAMPAPAAPAATGLDVEALGRLLAQRSVALRRELGAPPDEAGAQALRLGQRPDAPRRWLVVGAVYALVISWPVWASLTPVVAVVGGVVLHQVVRRERWRRRQHVVEAQVQADRRAAALTRLPTVDAPPTAATAGDHFALYLRPFYTTAQVPVGGVDLESLLAYALASTMPLVALGQPGEHIGAGRIQTSDEHWQAQVTALLRAARSILCIPSARPGTLWELRQLRQQPDLLAKTVFIMPRDFLVRRLVGQPPHRFADDWALTVQAATDAGLELPPFQPRGLLFELDAQGRLRRHLPFRADPFLGLIQKAASTTWEHIQRNDGDAGAAPADRDDAQAAPADSGDAVPYDLGGPPALIGDGLDGLSGMVGDVGWFDQPGADTGSFAAGAAGFDGSFGADTADTAGGDRGGGG